MPSQRISSQPEDFYLMFVVKKVKMDGILPPGFLIGIEEKMSKKNCTAPLFFMVFGNLSNIFTIKL